MVQVKKYGNRKLYNVDSSEYISMLELSDLVARGDEVQVVCDVSGNDITVETLARAFYERVKVRSSRSAITAEDVRKIIVKIKERG
jgi:polyhydroxyalkanoate synthesis regulator protein